MQPVSIQFHDLHPPENNFLDDVLSGLLKTPRIIPPKYFYDQSGSRLFDLITETEEYYPTRTEIQILKSNADEIAERIGSGGLLIEPGGGSCEKVRILLAGLQPRAYIPMDISKDHLRQAAEKMATEFPELEVHAACTDFTRKLQLPDSTPGGIRIAFFPGSSIGNFDPVDAVGFLTSIAEMVGRGGYLLIGVDLKKDSDILDRAYNDTAGVTAQFNLNLLSRINRELSADFDLSVWEHQAYYSTAHGRIEMHLKSTLSQIVCIGDHEFYFDQNETIHTENSYKYSVQEFQDLAIKAGFVPEQVWKDDEDYFSVHLFSVASH